MKIESLYHVIHLTEDRAPLDAWYDEVFLPRRGFMDANYYDGEQRDASLVTIADAVVEVLAPARFADGWDVMPIGRFFTRFGRHWHSIAWYVEDIGDAWERLRSHGLRVIFPGGAPGSDTTERLDADLHASEGDGHPTAVHAARPASKGLRSSPFRATIPGFCLGGGADGGLNTIPSALSGWPMSPSSLLTRRRPGVYVDVLDGRVVTRGSSPLTATDDVFVKVGTQTVIQISRPDNQPSLARVDLDTNGSMLHAVAFQVRDLDAAERHLRGNGVAVVGRDEHTLLADPADTFGAPFRFTVGTMGE